MFNSVKTSFPFKKHSDWCEDLLVSVDVAGTVCIAEVYESGVYHLVLLALIQQIFQVAEVSVAAPHSVAGAVLVQQEHLTRGEPTLTTLYDMVYGI